MLTSIILMLTNGSEKGHIAEEIIIRNHIDILLEILVFLIQNC